MKKVILSAFLGLIGLVAVNAQEGFKVEGTIGATIGDATDVFGINYGVAASYLYPVMENFHVGGKIGLDIFSGKEIMDSNYKVKNMTLIPITASAQYDITEQFFAGADLGFALSLNNDYNGGFYFMPKAGWQNEYIQVFGYLKGISSKIDRDLDPGDELVNDFNNAMGVGAGVAYKF